MSELIEKQKVLDVLREIATEKFSLDDPYGVYINVLMDVEEKICHLPVVQPNGPDNLANDSQDLVKDLANDTISRQAAIERATKDHDFYKGATTPADMARRDELLNVMCWLGELPSVEAIPVEWIESKIVRFRAMDNAFASLTAGQLQALLNDWRIEQNEG